MIPVLSYLYNFYQNKVIFLRLTHIPWRELKYALWLPFYLLAFVLVEHLPQASYWPTQLTLDNAIPFCEWFVIPYFFWFVFIIGMHIYTLLYDVPTFRKFIRYLAIIIGNNLCCIV